MRKSWVEVVAKLFVVCGKGLGFATATLLALTTHVYKALIYTPSLRQLIHSQKSTFLSYGGRLLPAFHNTYYKLLIKYISNRELGETI
jgi:hypothetical protein